MMGVQDDYSGERPKAYVVLKDGKVGTDEVGQELIKYVQDRKARTKWITEIQFEPLIPKSASGKILRRVLKDQLKKTDKETKVEDDVKEKTKL